MPCTVMGGSMVVASMKFRLVAGGVGKHGGANPGAPEPTYCCIVTMGTVGACVVVFFGPETGGACSPIVVVIVVVTGGI